MNKPTIRIHNTETDEVIDREMTDVEYKIHQEKIAESQERKAEAEAKATAKADILAKLGITAEEAQLLLGGN